MNTVTPLLSSSLSCPSPPCLSWLSFIVTPVSSSPSPSPGHLKKNVFHIYSSLSQLPPSPVNLFIHPVCSRPRFPLHFIYNEFDRRCIHPERRKSELRRRARSMGWKRRDAPPFFLFTYVVPTSSLWRSLPFPQCICPPCTFGSPQMRISTTRAQKKSGS